MGLQPLAAHGGLLSGAGERERWGYSHSLRMASSFRVPGAGGVGLQPLAAHAWLLSELVNCLAYEYSVSEIRAQQRLPSLTGGRIFVMMRL